MEYYLLFDLGTGNSRVSLVDSQGGILGIETFTNQYYREDAYEDAQYFLPKEWKENLLEGCTRLMEAHPDVRVSRISSAAARQSFLLMDEEAEAFLGLPNIDNRGREYMEGIKHRQLIYQLSGKWVTADFGAAKLLGLKNKFFDLYAKIHKITSLSEWIGAIFTGNIAMEYSQACESQLYDLQKRKWSTRLCDWYGIDMDILPPLVSCGESLGPVKKEYIERFHMAEDAEFIVGGADTQIAVRQTDIQEGDIAIVSGTTSPVVTLTSQYYYDRRQRVWVDADLNGQMYLLEMNPGVTGLNYQRMKAQFCGDVPYEELEAYYEDMTGFACTASFSSLLFYRRRGLKNGGFFMRSPLQDDLDRFQLMYAVLGDIACSIYEQLRRLMEISGNNPDYIRGYGGGFQSGTLCKMIASLVGKPILLEEGYSQATIQGLIHICKGKKQQDAEEKKGTVLIQPDQGNLIFEYYPLWNDNRNRANGNE